jgi:hypothetical protein
LAKEDVPPLGPVPKKRRQLEGALDVHVAMWLDSDGLTPSERRRVQEEKDRRRRARRDGPAVTLGFSGTREGMTPPSGRGSARSWTSCRPRWRGTACASGPTPSSTTTAARGGSPR